MIDRSNFSRWTGSWTTCTKLDTPLPRSSKAQPHAEIAELLQGQRDRPQILSRHVFRNLDLQPIGAHLVPGQRIRHPGREIRIGERGGRDVDRDELRRRRPIRPGRELAEGGFQHPCIDLGHHAGGGGDRQELVRRHVAAKLALVQRSSASTQSTRPVVTSTCGWNTSANSFFAGAIANSPLQDLLVAERRLDLFAEALDAGAA